MVSYLLGSDRPQKSVNYKGNTIPKHISRVLIALLRYGGLDFRGFVAGPGSRAMGFGSWHLGLGLGWVLGVSVFRQIKA